MTRGCIAWLSLVALPLASAAAGASTAYAQGLPPPGASSCSGCHPISAAVDTPVKRLVGRNPEEIIEAVKAFRSGEKPATIMDRIAKGFSDDEIKKIADWYGAQKE